MLIVFVIGIIVGIVAIIGVLRLTMNPEPKGCLIAMSIVITLVVMVLLTLYQTVQTISTYYL